MKVSGIEIEKKFEIVLEFFVPGRTLDYSQEFSEPFEENPNYSQIKNFVFDFTIGD